MMRSETTPLWRTLRLGACILFFPLATGCDYWRGYLQSKQVRTFAEIQGITSRIEALRQRDPDSVTAAAIENAIAQSRGGRDAWGHPIAYAITSERGVVNYVIVSAGRDGRLDVETIDKYFTSAPERVSGQWDRDVVFRNGDPLLNAGK
jgi:hypothetical protein